MRNLSRWLLAMLVAVAITTAHAETKDEQLPDLGAPSQQSDITLKPSDHGISLEQRSADKRITISPEYSRQTGFGVGIQLATLLNERTAAGLLFTGGSDKQELLVNLGLQLDARSRIVLTAGQLRQRLEFYFPSGDARARVHQNMGAIQYQRELDFGMVKGFEVDAYATRSPGRNLADKTYTIDTAASFEIWNDPRRVAGGDVYGLKGRVSVSPIAGSLVKLGFGAERLSYDYLTGEQSTTRATFGAEWQQQLTEDFRLKLSADQFAAQRSYGAELTKASSGFGQFALGAMHIEGRDGAPDDNRVSLSYSMALGGSTPSAVTSGNQREAAAPATRNATASSPHGSLLDAVAQRPSFLPSQVVAVRDVTDAPTRILAVTKGGLPAGTTISPTGMVTVPLPNAATAITTLTLNAVAIANVAFSASGNTLTIDTSKIVQPAVGVTDTYVVTTNSVPADTVTILVQHGSILIKQITVTAGVATYPYRTVYGDVCTTYAATPGCTFNTNGTRITVNQDPWYNRYGFGSDDLWYVKFYADGTADVYNDLGLYQYTTNTSLFAGWIGGNTLGVGTTGLFWENVSGKTYWLGKNGVLYNAMTGESNYAQAIN